MKIGYARKSTHLQDVAHQVDELTKAGCEQIGTVAKVGGDKLIIPFC
ncbi:recombinase family protein [Enterobacter hormaechei]